MSIVRPALFRDPGVLVALSTREGPGPDTPRRMNLSFNVGDDAEQVRANRSLFFGTLGIREDELAVPRQVHGTNIVRVDAPGPVPDTDGLITSRNRIFLCISFADCIPILLFDPMTRTIGALHSGWRGTAGRIAEVGVRRMEEEFGVKADNLLAYIGPGAGACCYEVGEEVAGRLEARFVRHEPKLAADLRGAIVAQLIDAGCCPENVEASPACTIHDLRFHSFRRDGDLSGRMIACIGLNPLK